MRPVLLNDVSTAARALLAVPAEERVAFCACLIRQAEIAGRYARRLGRLHPTWGNGTLLAAARQHPIQPEPTLDDPAYLQCFLVVLEVLRDKSAGCDL